MSPAQAVLDYLREHNLGREGADEHLLVCPAHPDTPESPNACYNRRKEVWHCQRCGQGGSARDLARRLGLISENGNGPSGNIVAEYDYTDEAGNLLFQVVRLEPKTFRQRRPDGAGGWIWNLQGTRRVPYHLTYLLNIKTVTSTVWIVEGEKDVHTLESHGLIATTNPGGAGKWSNAYNRYLEGREVNIIPDNDKAGEDHAVAVANQLLGVGCIVKLVRLPGTAARGDVTEWLAGRTVDALLSLADQTPLWTWTETPSAPPEAEYPLTDAGNAEVLAHLHGDRMRFLWDRNRWLVWRGQRWGSDDAGYLQRWAVETARFRLQQAALLEDNEARKRAVTFARMSENSGKVEATLKMVRSVDPVAATGAGWDQQPWLLACENGVINLKTGKLQQGAPEQRLTQGVPYDYDAKATCPAWESFLTDLFPLHPEVLPWFRKVLGYSISGSTEEQMVLILHGAGANGKSTLLEVLAEVLGEYSATIAFRTIEAGYDRSVPSDMAALESKRFVFASETKEGSQIHEGRIKSLSGGERITARKLYENEYTFVPVLKLFVAVNHRPLIRDDSEGMWRRLRLVPFDAKFDAASRINDMKERLLKEKQGILTWLVEACLDYQREGLETPAVVAVSTADYRASSDLFAEWIAEKCLVNAKAWMKANAAYGSYKTWAEGQGYSQRELLSSRTFGRLFGEKWPRRRQNDGRWYVGITLSDHPEFMPDVLISDSDAVYDAPSNSLGTEATSIHQIQNPGVASVGSVYSQESGVASVSKVPQIFSPQNFQKTFNTEATPDSRSYTETPYATPGIEATTQPDICGCYACPADPVDEVDCSGKPLDDAGHCSVCHDKEQSPN